MRKLGFLSILFLFFYTKISALVVGNPSDPELYLNGIFTCNKKNFSVRGSFLYNNLYKGRFEDKTENISSTPSDIKIKTYSGILTFNFFNRLDIYGILGTSDFEIDQMTYAIDLDTANLDITQINYSDKNLSWGAGLKIILFKIHNFDFSFDGKYFTTYPKPKFFIVNKETYILKSPFEQTFEEYQACLGISYLTNFLIPYIGATFLYSTINADKKICLISPPGTNDTYDYETNDSETRRKWGLVLGISIINKKNQASLNLETRMFDQNAFAFIGTLRF